MRTLDLLNQLETKIDGYIHGLPYDDQVFLKTLILQTAVTALSAHTHGKFNFDSDLAFAVKS